MKYASTVADTMWTVKDVMTRLSIKRTCATQIIKQLPHVQIGRALRVERSLVEEWIHHHYVRPQTAEAIKAAPRKPKYPPCPGMDENGKLLRKRKDGSFYAATSGQKSRSA